MSDNPWRLGTRDELLVELEQCDVFCDRVSGNPLNGRAYQLANVHFVFPGGVMTVADMSAADLREVAAMLTDFATILEVGGNHGERN